MSLPLRDYFGFCAYGMHASCMCQTCAYNSHEFKPKINITSQFKTVRVKAGMSLRNGMWHGLRNDIIMRNLICAAEWSKEIKLKRAPFFWRQSICKRCRCFNVAYDDNQKTTKAHCRPALKDSSSIEEKMFSKVTLPSTLINFFSKRCLYD